VERIPHNNGERKAGRSEAGGHLSRGASKRLPGDLVDQGGDAATLRAYLVSLGVRLGWVGAHDKEESALAAVIERLRHDGVSHGRYIAFQMAEVAFREICLATSCG
jgi:hypothetical protein